MHPFDVLVIKKNYMQLIIWIKYILNRVLSIRDGSVERGSLGIGKKFFLMDT